MRPHNNTRSTPRKGPQYEFFHSREPFYDSELALDFTALVHHGLLGPVAFWVSGADRGIEGGAPAYFSSSSCFPPSFKVIYEAGQPDVLSTWGWAGCTDVEKRHPEVERVSYLRGERAKDCGGRVWIDERWGRKKISEELGVCLCNCSETEERIECIAAF